MQVSLRRSRDGGEVVMKALGPRVRFQEADGLREGADISIVSCTRVLRCGSALQER